jgi:hypothetical protein
MAKGDPMLQGSFVRLMLAAILTLGGCGDEIVDDAVPGKDASADQANEAGKETSATDATESGKEAGTTDVTEGGKEAGATDATVADLAVTDDSAFDGGGE